MLRIFTENAYSGVIEQPPDPNAPDPAGEAIFRCTARFYHFAFALHLSSFHAHFNVYITI